MARIAFYGGTFDPVHNGHLAVAASVSKQFSLDQFVFIPAFHAPHKQRSKPTSAFDRFALLCLATADTAFSVSKLEIELPERPYTVESLARLKENFPNDVIFFVMGADSWLEISTWREWEKVLTATNHIVVTRPGFELTTNHVTDGIRSRIVDTRGDKAPVSSMREKIFFTNSVNMEISATSIRRRIRAGDDSWRLDLPESVAKYIEKYQIYN